MLSEPPWSPRGSEFLTSLARLPVPHISAPLADVGFTQPANRPVEATGFGDSARGAGDAD